MDAMMNLDITNPRVLLKANVVLEVYYHAAIHLPYPPTFLQLCEDCESIFSEEFIDYVAEHSLYSRYNVVNYNELIELIHSGEITDHLIEPVELRAISDALNLHLHEDRHNGVW